MEKQIKKIVSDHFGISEELLEAKTRKREIVIARQTAMKLISMYTYLSLKNVGRLFGGRDHSTVIHANTTVQDMIDTDRKYKMHWDALHQKIALEYLTA